MVSEKWYAIWEAVWCYRRGHEFMSLISYTGHFTSPLSFPQLKNEGVEMNSGLSVLTCCILRWPGLKSGFFSPCSGCCHPVSSSHTSHPQSFQSEFWIILFLPPSISILEKPCAAACIPLELWVVQWSQQSEGDWQSCFLTRWLQLAQKFNKTCLLPVFTTVAPGMQECNSERAQFNQVKAVELTAVSRCVSEDPTDAVTFPSKWLKMKINRIEGPCLNQTTALALMSQFEVLQLPVHSCFSIEVSDYCW